MLLNRASIFALWITMAGSALPADGPLVDRGLPQANVNNASGPVRSNVRWGWHDHGFLGDDFTIGAPGERWVIDSIRTWVVPGTAEFSYSHLGDFYQDVRLHFGATDLTPVSTAQLSVGSDETSSGDVVVSDAAESGALLYDDFGAPLRVWQIDFKGLKLAVEGGVKQRFGVWGNGRSIPGKDGQKFMWYNHASNAGLSGNRQESTDGLMLLFDAAGRFEGTFNANGNGWDKSADINVQVFAHRVDARRPTKGQQ
jgi:hypothetical protein